MADFATLLAQAIHALAEDSLKPPLPDETRQRRRVRLEAYAWLARQPSFGIFLEDLARTYLVAPCEDAYQEGARRLVLEIVKALALAKAELMQAGEEE